MLFAANAKQALARLLLTPLGTLTGYSPPSTWLQGGILKPPGCAVWRETARKKARQAWQA